MHGWVLRDNEKMSKSKGNFFEPEDLINGTIEELQKNKSYSKIKGIETFRFYSLGATQPGRDLNFNVKEYADTYRTINTLWNVFVYANQKFRLSEFDPSEYSYDIENLSKTDKWLLSKTNSTIKEITELSNDYKLSKITEKVHGLIINHISRWYIMLIRDKIDVYSEDPDKFQVMALLFDVLYKVLLLLAPITPMLSEHLYLQMFKPFLSGFGKKETESIHLQDWPEVDEDAISEDLENQMDFTKELIEVARSLKNKNRLRLRWPNKQLIIESTEELPDIEFTETIKKMINVKELKVVDSFTEDGDFAQIESKYGDIYLDLSVDDSLLAERVTNDLIRNIQYTRKNNDFQVGEEISLKIGSNTPYLNEFVEMNRELIADKVSASKFDIIDESFQQKDAQIFKVLNICPNKECSASLKKNAMKRVENKPDVKCPYCGTALEEDQIKVISFTFQKRS